MIKLNYITAFFSNSIVSAILISWLAAQLIKVAIVLITSKKLDLSRLYGAGGMPSSHSSLVSTLVIMALRTEGIGSTAFAISFAFAIIVMYDATGVRRQAGEHAKRINILIEEWMARNNMKIDNNLKELLGHTPFEVIMGAILGIIIGIIYPV